MGPTNPKFVIFILMHLKTDLA